jgi:hypothetical protein
VRIGRLRGFLPLSEESNPMATHGNGTLSSLIRSRSATSLAANTQQRRSSSIVAGREPSTPNDEEAGLAIRRGRDSFDDPHRAAEERRASSILNDPRMRSMRLIGNSNPRYNWRQYWKTEEELKQMKKPM